MLVLSTYLVMQNHWCCDSNKQVLVLQTRYKTMAHIKDQAQQYLDSAIRR